MGATNIEWCSHSLNAIKWWCDRISPGCENCYMMALKERYPQHGAEGPVWRGERAFDELMSFPSGAEIFHGDMYDMFHGRMPAEFIHEQVENWPRVRPDCTHLFLTKRIKRPLRMNINWGPNVYLGTSVENQEWTWRIDWLKQIPAKGKFLSLEPLLGPIEYDFTGIDGVIVGAESGANRRPYDPQWAEDIRLQCAEQGIRFFYKQGSAHKPGQHRELFGREYNDLPWRQPLRVPVPVKEVQQSLW